MSKNSITITGLDLLKAMENAQTPLNPFLIKKDMMPLNECLKLQNR